MLLQGKKEGLTCKNDIVRKMFCRIFTEVLMWDFCDSKVIGHLASWIIHSTAWSICIHDLLVHLRSRSDHIFSGNFNAFTRDSWHGSFTEFDLQFAPAEKTKRWLKKPKTQRPEVGILLIWWLNDGTRWLKRPRSRVTFFQMAPGPRSHRSRRCWYLQFTRRPQLWMHKCMCTILKLRTMRMLWSRILQWPSHVQHFCQTKNGPFWQCQWLQLYNCRLGGFGHRSLLYKKILTACCSLGLNLLWFHWSMAFHISCIVRWEWKKSRGICSGKSNVQFVNASFVGMEPNVLERISLASGVTFLIQRNVFLASRTKTNLSSKPEVRAFAGSWQISKKVAKEIHGS